MKGMITPQPAAGRTTPAPGRAQILVVEDDEDSREMLRLQLKGAGYSVTTAEDAVEAAHYVVEHLPDLIVADFRMPYMTGIEFIGALRGDPTIPDVPVIFITAVENSGEVAGRTFGYPLLTKPLIADELLAAVAAQLRLRRPPSR